MPSQLHEVLLLLFRNRPALAPELLRDTLNIELPSPTYASTQQTSQTFSPLNIAPTWSCFC
jgi:hypothetical protein